MLQPDVGGAFEPYELWSDGASPSDVNSIAIIGAHTTANGNANHFDDAVSDALADRNSVSNAHVNDRSDLSAQSDGDAIGGTNGYSHTCADLTLHPW